jgi:hypothetical protein
MLGIAAPSRYPDGLYDADIGKTTIERRAQSDRGYLLDRAPMGGEASNMKQQF